MKWLLGALLSLSVTTRAEDLETLLEGGGGKADVATSRQQSFLTDTLRSLVSGAPTAAQNTFFRALENGEWDKALLQDPAAFGGTEFERSANGQALQAYLKFKNGLTTTGLEELFAIQDPKKIHFQLLNSWKDAAVERHPAWTTAMISWAPVWTDVFGLGIEVKAKTRRISHKQSIEELKELRARAPADSRELAMIEWNLALAYSLADQADQAAKIVAALLKTKNSPISPDLLHLTAARLLFQNGYFDAAVKYDEKIPKGSDYWLDAQEEAAWAYIRKGEPQNAIAVTETLVKPVFKGQVGAESHFVRALAQLKICDYPGVVKGLQNFSPEFKGRTANLKKIMAEPEQPAIQKVLADLRTRDVKWEELGSATQQMPRLITRDQRLQDLVRAQDQLEREAKAAEELYAKSLAQTGLQSAYENLHQSLLNRARMAKSASLARVQDLAKNEVTETGKILGKMHIVEAEVIQQVAGAEKLAKAMDGKRQDAKVGATGSKSRDTLSFPADGNEVWFDELSNYKVDVKKACQR